MRIGDLAHQTGVPTKTIRYYEDYGVMPQPRRSPNGYRDYDDDAIERLLFIRDAQATGLTLSEIASIGELRSQGLSTCDHVVELLEQHMGTLDEHIKRLETTRRHLVDLMERAKGLDPADCTDPHRCQTISTSREGRGDYPITNAVGQPIH